MVVPGQAAAENTVFQAYSSYLWLCVSCHKGICCATCTHPTGSLLIFFSFFTRSFAFTSERLEEGEDIFEAACGASS